MSVMPVIDRGSNPYNTITTAIEGGSAPTASLMPITKGVIALGLPSASIISLVMAMIETVTFVTAVPSHDELGERPMGCLELLKASLSCPWLEV